MPKETFRLKTRSGQTLTAFRGDQISEAIARHGEYDALALSALRSILGRIAPKVSLDIGANIGNHALVIGSLSDRLLAFEPVDFIFRILESNLAENFGGKAMAFNIALSDTDTKCSIGLPDAKNFGAYSLEETMSKNAQLVEVSTRIGDHFLMEQGIEAIDFIKIDVEGHEARVVQGLASTIKHQQPLLMLEWRHEKTLQDFSLQHIFATVFAGYTVFALTRTDNKKLFPRTSAGYVTRLLRKLHGVKWCLTDFQSDQRYSNIFLVPQRFAAIFSALDHAPARNRNCIGT